MFERSLEVLELPKIIELVAKHTSFPVSRELAYELRPVADLQEARRLQRLTTEARLLLDSRPNASAAGAHDIRESVRRAGLSAVLDPGELLDIASTLAVSRAVRGTILRAAGPLPASGSFAGLVAIAERITPLDDLELEIRRCIDAHGEVVDEASPILKRVRSEVKIAHQRLTARLENILNSPRYKHIIQDPIVTIREGRYVIPIKADFKGQIKGIVHDHSASGATVFVEPLATVDLNNHWRDLQLQEQREVQRILRSLSSNISVHADDIQKSVHALAEIDLLLAKARYSAAIQGIEPLLIGNEEACPDTLSKDGTIGACPDTLSKNGTIGACPDTSSESQRTGAGKRGGPFLDIKRARHPLLQGNVVPIDVRLGGHFLILVITGPNTGGKTVALKTVGLLTLMAQCGLHIPADEGSRVRVFRRVYADIGDEQSIEQSLSTFSSHMKTIIQVLARADEDTLVLLDELGAGTDPAEGSALARSILSFLIRRRIPTLATTHYSELKAYAHSVEGVENACVEFDPETLAPTYRLTIGLPGRSNALSIASRLGVPREVIEDAERFMNPAETRVDGLLQQIQLERDRAALDLRAAESVRESAEAIERDLREQRQRLRDERDSILQKAREEAELEIAEVRRHLRAAEDLIRGADLDREKLRQAVAEVREAQRSLETSALEGAGPDAKANRSRREAFDVEYLHDTDFQVGDYVLVRSLNQHGEIVAVSPGQGEVEVSLGNFKVRVRTRELTKTRGRPGVSGKPHPDVLTSTSALSRPSPPSEIEVRGWRVEEVLPVLDRYIDDAYLAGLTTVRIIHGKGTGVLRQVVREMLAKHPLVRSFETASLREGGEGVTVATLAN